MLLSWAKGLCCKENIEIFILWVDKWFFKTFSTFNDAEIH